MVSLMALWLPILLSAVAVFIVSSIIHMVFKYHNSDYSQVPNEDAVMEGMRAHNIPPGDYVMPHAPDLKAAGTDAFKEKQNKGPVVVMTVQPSGPCGMGQPLLFWFLFCLVIGVLVAYIARMSLPAGTDYLLVHRVTGATAFCAYGLGQLPNSIWFKKSWSGTLKNVFDGLVYGLVTGGVFGWLWPGV